MGWFKKEVDYWWPKLQFIIENLRTIVFAGAVVWALFLLTLDVFGAIDIKTECPPCARIIEKVIPDANAATGASGIKDDALIRFRVVILPE
ncbi:hypothetical protein [Ferrovibrio sp.]|uniref:hypothetical protein n=1 Tax=Ferrovibrio sp. TaxID=1917215 RepID=UPI0035B04AF8